MVLKWVLECFSHVCLRFFFLTVSLILFFPICEIWKILLFCYKRQVFWFLIFSFTVLGIEHRASFMLSKHSTTELWSKPLIFFLKEKSLLTVARMVLHSVVRQAWTLVSNLNLSSRWEYKPLPLHLAPSSFWLICIWVRIKLCLMSCFLDLKFTLKEGICRGKLPRGGKSWKLLWSWKWPLALGVQNPEFNPCYWPTFPPKKCQLENWLEIDKLWISVASFPSGFRTGYLTNKLESLFWDWSHAAQSGLKLLILLPLSSTFQVFEF